MEHRESRDANILPTEGKGASRKPLKVLHIGDQEVPRNCPSKLFTGCKEKKKLSLNSITNFSCDAVKVSF